MIGKKQRNSKLRKPELKPELKKCLNCFKRALPPPQCKCIPSKCDCPPGPPGPQGPAGPQGATGSLGGVLAFADFFALMPPDNAVTVAPGTDVDFRKMDLLVGWILSGLLSIPFSYFQGGVKTAINICILLVMDSRCFISV